jgi:hypothetical protein
MSVRFYVGLHQPADAQHFGLSCISINRIRGRKKPVECPRVLVDSGAFTELNLYSGYRDGVEEYAAELYRLHIQCVIKIEAAVAQDYMCEPLHERASPRIQSPAAGRHRGGTGAPRRHPEIQRCTYWRVAGFLKPNHFHEKLHGDLFEVMGTMIAEGRPANPITMKPYIPAEQMVGEKTLFQYVIRVAFRGGHDLRRL